MSIRHIMHPCFSVLKVSIYKSKHVVFQYFVTVDATSFDKSTCQLINDSSKGQNYLVAVSSLVAANNGTEPVLPR